jgi:hypothetical protein
VYYRDTSTYPLKGLFNPLSKENRTVVVPDVIGKLDSMISITPPIDSINSDKSLHSIYIPNVLYSTIRVSLKNGRIKASHCNKQEFGYSDTAKVNAFCFTIVPNDTATSLFLSIQAVINDSIIIFKPRTIYTK